MKKILLALCVCVLILSCLGCESTYKWPTTGTTPVTTTTKQPPTTTTQAVETTSTTAEPPRTEMSIPDLAEFAQSCTVTVIADGDTFESSGSGFFIDDNGTLVTSYHVIDGADSVIVKDKDGAKYDVTRVVDFSELYDIAVLRIGISGNKYLKIVEENPRTGERVYAVGSPLGLSETFSDGLVSNSSRMVGMIECIQTTAPISSGNSGGPLVNGYGEVVGINAFSYVSGNDMNLAVKISELNMLDMNKEWTMAQYREWYKKEIDRSYKVYNYLTQEYELSKINTYQIVTGQECALSALTWGILEDDYEYYTHGYDEEYGIFCYEYDFKEFDIYTEYLNSQGYVFKESEDYTQGVSYFYMNEYTGVCMDLFVTEGNEWLIIEPSYGQTD